MDLTVRVAEIGLKQTSTGDRASHFGMTVLYRKLAVWYKALPAPLRWGSLPPQNAPSVYFLLHQQYHATAILLHTQFTVDDAVVSEPPHGGSAKGRGQAQAQSQSVCFDHAVRITKILRLHEKYFHIKTILTTGAQHVAAAAEILVKGMPLTHASDNDVIQAAEYLDYLTSILQTNSETYAPAEKYYHDLSQLHLSRVFEDSAANMFLDCPIGESFTHNASLNSQDSSSSTQPIMMPPSTGERELTSLYNGDMAIHFDDVENIEALDSWTASPSSDRSDLSAKNKRRDSNSQIFQISENQAVPISDSIFFGNELEMLGILSSSDSEAEESPKWGFPQWPGPNLLLTS